MSIRRVLLFLFSTFLALFFVGCSSPAESQSIPVVPTTSSPPLDSQDYLGGDSTTGGIHSDVILGRTAQTSLLVIPTNPTDPGYNHVTGIYASACIYAATDNKELPAKSCTPGSVRSDVTQDTISSTICVKDWTRLVRPPKGETDKIKTLAMRAYGESPLARATTELDHLVPLELGGSSDASNLWPEPSDIPNDGFRNLKDPIENRVKVAVCAHEKTSVYPQGITLLAARLAIANDWTTAEVVLGIPRR